MYGMNGGAQCVNLEIMICQERKLGWHYACRKSDLDVYTVVGCWVSENGIGGISILAIVIVLIA